MLFGYRRVYSISSYLSFLSLSVPCHPLNTLPIHLSAPAYFPPSLSFQFSPPSSRFKMISTDVLLILLSDKSFLARQPRTTDLIKLIYSNNNNNLPSSLLPSLLHCFFRQNDLRIYVPPASVPSLCRRTATVEIIPHLLTLLSEKEGFTFYI
jgi:hypothetical protein